MSRLTAEYEPDTDWGLTGEEAIAQRLLAPIALVEFLDQRVSTDVMRERAQAEMGFVNRGAHLELIYGTKDPDDPRWQVEGQYDPRADRVDERMLQPDYTIVRGAGGGGGGGKSKAPPKFDEAKARARMGLDDTVIEQRHFPRLKASVGSRGVRDFYDRRPGTALQVLQRYVLRIEAEGFGVEQIGVPKRVQRIDMVVYGLTSYQLGVLRIRKGSAGLALTEYAYAEAGSRITDIDRRLAA